MFVRAILKLFLFSLILIATGYFIGWKWTVLLAIDMGLVVIFFRFWKWNNKKGLFFEKGLGKIWWFVTSTDPSNKLSRSYSFRATNESNESIRVGLGGWWHAGMESGRFEPVLHEVTFSLLESSMGRFDRACLKRAKYFNVMKLCVSKIDRYDIDIRSIPPLSFQTYDPGGYCSIEPMDPKKHYVKGQQLINQVDFTKIKMVFDGFSTLYIDLPPRSIISVFFYEKQPSFWKYIFQTYLS